jgi:hypothetical protein
MKTVILVIISIFSIYYLIIRGVNRLLYKDENKKLIENINKHETLTGGLENDRINERP